jgi:hypothetical protein
MRDYTLTRAMAAESIGNSPVTLFWNWQARRRVACLANCSDGILKSLALTKEDVQWAMGLPLAHDPERALEDCAFRRSRGDGRLPALPENALASKPGVDRGCNSTGGAGCSAGSSGLLHMALRWQ